jgi:hypothetical protein
MSDPEESQERPGFVRRRSEGEHLLKSRDVISTRPESYAVTGPLHL